VISVFAEFAIEELLNLSLHIQTVGPELRNGGREWPCCNKPLPQWQALLVLGGTTKGCPWMRDPQEEEALDKPGR
jgi:hypothetical protein